jgi:hypothetical protein
MMDRAEMQELWIVRRAWSRLPRHRRAALWRGSEEPRDQGEAETALGFARFTRSILGTAEWVVAGLVGALVILLLGIWTGSGSVGTYVVMAAGWTVTWSALGVPLRRARAGSMHERATSRSSH